MALGKRWWQGIAAMVLASMLVGQAVAQVTTRFVTAGGAATSVKILPGASTSMDVRLDTTTSTVILAYQLTQTAPALNGFLSITGRDVVTAGNFPVATKPNATVLAAASALLDPTNNSDLGSTTADLAVPVPAGLNILAATLAFTAPVTTPLGTYVIDTIPASFVTSDLPLGTGTDYAMTATYTIIVGQTLTVTTNGGTGTGNVKASTGLIDCGVAGLVCSDIYPGTAVTLTPTNGTGVFANWTGDCSGSGPCVVTVDQARNVGAVFILAPQQLNVTIAGAGTGSVTIAPPGTVCSTGTCSPAPYAANSTVLLTAAPTGTSSFTGWTGGGCPAVGLTCTVTMNQTQNVTATFGLQTFNLTVVKSGNGSGTVTSLAPNLGINCGATCVFGFQATTVVTLHAVADPGKNFIAWVGAPGCGAGPADCAVTINAATSVTANFTDTIAPIVLTLVGPSSTSSPNPSFTFTADDPTATFTCSLDGGAAIPCTSPATVSVGNGAHTFTVIATDPAGNPSAPSTVNWTSAGIVATNVPVPTLNEWMLVLLALVLGSAGILARRRKE